jgi:hypothetical protein
VNLVAGEVRGLESPGVDSDAVQVS